MTPITYVLVSRNPLSEFLFEHLHHVECVKIIEHPLPPRPRMSWIFRRVVDAYVLAWSKRSLHFDRTYTEQLKRIRPEDSVVYFAIENRKDLQIARKFIASRQQFVWLWNPFRCSHGGILARSWYLFWLRRAGIRPCTFEPSDARDFGFELVDQVYRFVSSDDRGIAREEDPRRDVYFLGLDKGRLQILKALKSDLEEAGLSTHFHIFARRHERYGDEDRNYLSHNWISYTENIRNVLNSSAIVEIIQTGQSGPTIRSMEALFLNRKLISNNAALRQASFYHPSRIFILGEDSIETIRDFLSGPSELVDPEVLRRHDIEHWIRHFAPAYHRINRHSPSAG